MSLYYDYQDQVIYDGIKSLCHGHKIYKHHVHLFYLAQIGSVSTELSWVKIILIIIKEPSPHVHRTRVYSWADIQTQAKQLRGERAYLYSIRY